MNIIYVWYFSKVAQKNVFLFAAYFPSCAATAHSKLYAHVARAVTSINVNFFLDIYEHQETNCFLQLVDWEEHVIFRADKIFSGAIPIFIFFILQCQEKQILRQEYHQRRHQ